MAVVHEQVVRSCREQQVGELRRRQAVGDRGAQAALRRVLAARLDEAPEPGAKHLGAALVRGQRVEVEVGRAALDVAGDVQQAVVQRPRPVRRCEHVLHVRHAGQDRESGRPARRPIAHAEARRLVHQRLRLARLAQPDDALGDDQRQVLLQALHQLASPVRDAFLVLHRRRVEPDATVPQLDLERREVVGERVEGAAAGELEARVVPVAGQDAVARSCHGDIGKPMCGQRLSTA